MLRIGEYNNLNFYFLFKYSNFMIVFDLIAEL